MLVWVVDSKYLLLLIGRFESAFSKARYIWCYYFRITNIALLSMSLTYPAWPTGTKQRYRLLLSHLQALSFGSNQSSRDASNLVVSRL
jgi:hypothetical protein